MSLLKRYADQNIQRYEIKYQTNNKMTGDYIQEINKIYKMIKEVYKHNKIVLSGTGALVYYIVNLKYNDLIQKITSLNVLKFFIVEPSKETVINIPYIDDFQRQDQQPAKKSLFKNFWSNANITEFSLELINNINSMNVKEIPLVDILELKKIISNPKHLKLIDEIIRRINS